MTVNNIETLNACVSTLSKHAKEKTIGVEGRDAQDG